MNETWEELYKGVNVPEGTREEIDASSLDYETLSKCDRCGGSALGTMFHARGATGRICAVLFLCNECK